MCTFKYKTNSSLKARTSGYPYKKKHFKNEVKSNYIPGVFPQWLDKLL